MKKFFITCLLLCGFLLTANTGTAASNEAKKGLSFTENRGQVTDTRGNARPDVLYTAENQGVKIFFRNDAVSYVFPQIENTGGESKVTALFRADVEFVGANPNFRVVSENPVEGVSNFYLGQGKGVTGAKSFSKITYKNLYPNIDLVFFASGESKSQMKYEFVVRPGGKVQDIQLRYTGASRVNVNRDGSLQTVTPFGNLNEDAPYTYQAGKTIASSYQLNNGILTYQVGDYDKNADLVIDPLTRPWATNYGGSLFDRALGSGMDNAGNTVITGTTASINFPVTAGAAQAVKANNNDAFVTVFNADGTVRFSTYFGGANTEQGNDAAFDANGNIGVVGYTVSTDLPVSGGFQNTPGGAGDGFIASMTSTGALRWSSYFGGGAQDELRGIAVWPNGDFFTTGRAFSANLNTIGGGINGSRDAVLARVRGNGSLAWSSYFGGSGDDQGFAVSVDTNGDMVATGSTTSANNIATPNAAQGSFGGGTDAFVVKFNGQGQRLWSSYFGGNASDLGNGVATDNANNVYITGQTSSANLTTTNNAPQRTFGGVQDAFVASMNPNGGLTMSSYLGGQSSEQGYGVAAFGGNVYVTGATNSPNFAIVNPNADNTLPFQSTLGGNFDAFLTKINATSGVRQWSIVYGGSADDIARDLSSNASGALAIVGYTNSANIPTRNRVVNTNPSTGNDDALVIMLRDDVSGCPSIGVTAMGTNPTCAGNDGRIMVSAPAGGAAPFSYSVNGGAFGADNTISGLTAGTYTVTVRDANNCTGASAPIVLTQSNTANFMVNVMQANNLRCNGDKTQLTVNVMGGGVAPFSYQLNNGTPQIQNVFTNIGGGAYSITVRDANNCVVTTSGMVMEPQVITFQALITDANCTTGQKASVTINATGGGTPPYQYSINGGQSFQSSNMFMNLNPMMISAVIRDANNCLSEVEMKEIRSTGGVMVGNVVNASPSCGGLANGSITVTATSGTLPYTYSLNNGTAPVTTSSASYTFNGLAGGNYIVTISDARGCRDSRTVQLNEPAPLNITAVTGLSPTSCVTNNGTIVITATGGTGELMYSIDGGVNFSMMNTFTNLRSGKYNVVVRDRSNAPNACQTMTMYDVVQANAPTILAVTPRDPICSNTNLLNTGEITIKATGNVTLLYYSIDDGANWFSSSTGSYTFFNLSPATYTVRVAESMNVECASYRTVTLNAPDPVLINNVFRTQPVCGTTTTGGTITVDASGGNGVFEYSVDGGKTWSSSNTFTGLFPRPEGYTVVVRDANDCMDEDGPYYMVNPSGLNLPTPLITNPTCGQMNGRITVAPTGGTLPRKYFLNNMDIPVDVNSNSSYTFTNLKEGVNVLRVQDAAGCVVEYSVDLQVIRAKFTVNNATSCALPTTAATSGSIKVDIEGGVGPFTYAIKGVNITTTTTTNPFGALAFTSPALRSKTYTYGPSSGLTLAPGMYVSEIRDLSNPNNCVRRDTLVIQAPTSPLPGNYTVNVTNRTCSSANGSGPGVAGRIQVTGIAGNFHLISENGVVASQANTTGDFQGLAAGKYFLYINNGNTTNCLFYAGMWTVTEPAPITLNVITTQPNCTTTPAGRIEVIATGGRLLEYSFDAGVTWQRVNVLENIDPTPATPDFVAGQIRVRETGINACDVRWNTPIDIVRTSGLVIAFQGAAVPASCESVPNGESTVRVTDATVGPYSYFVDGVLRATTPNVVYNFTGLYPGPRVFMVRDGNGCARILRRDIPLNPAATLNQIDPLATVLTPPAACNDGSIALALTGPWATATDLQVSINGGGTFTAPTTLAGANAQLVGLPAGTYVVVVKRVGEPCTISRTFTLANNNPTATQITVNSITFRNPTCPGTNDGRIDIMVTLTGAGAGRVRLLRASDRSEVARLDGPAPQQIYNLTVPNLGAGNYIVEIDKGTCSINTNVTTTRRDLLNVQLVNPTNSGVVINNIGVTQPDCSVSSVGTVTINATGGTTGALEYTINNGASWQSSNTFTNVTPGTIPAASIRARQAGSLCSANEAVSPVNVTISLPSGLNFNTVITQPGCTNAGARGKIDVTLLGGAAPIRLFLNDELRHTFPSNLVNTYSFENLTPGSYAVRMVDNRGCTLTRTVLIQSGTSITTNATITNPSGCGLSDGSLKLTLVGGNFTTANAREYRLIANGVTGPWIQYGGANETAVNVDINALSAGVYLVEARNVNDVCIATSIPFLLSDPSSASVSRITANPPNNLNCNNGSIVVTLGGVGAGNIRYEISKDRGLTWSAMQTSPFFINLTEGEYYIRVRSGFGTNTAPFCYRYASVGVLNCTFNQTKVENNNNINSISVYPNPTKGQFSINYTSFTNENVKATLIDATGRTIANYNFTAVEGENAFEVDLANQTSGIYLLQVTTPNGLSTVKVVKE